MGYKIEMNWVLKLEPEQGLNEKSLKEANIYDFEKDEERIYPINIPIFLVNKNWDVIAKVVIPEITIGHGKTKGKYKILEIFEKKRKSMYYRC